MCGKGGEECTEVYRRHTLQYSTSWVVRASDEVSTVLKNTSVHSLLRRGRGWGRSQIIRRWESLVLYKSFNTILVSQKICACRPFILSQFFFLYDYCKLHLPMFGTVNCLKMQGQWTEFVWAKRFVLQYNFHTYMVFCTKGASVANKN